VAAAVVEELKEDEWNLNELERMQQEQARPATCHSAAGRRNCIAAAIVL
jgi:hypothetical protein